MMARRQSFALLHGKWAPFAWTTTTTTALLCTVTAKCSMSTFNDRNAAVCGRVDTAEAHHRLRRCTRITREMCGHDHTETERERELIKQRIKKRHELVTNEGRKEGMRCLDEKGGEREGKA